MNKTILAGLATMAILLPSHNVQAHHSFAKFDSNKEVVIRGTVTQFQWTNPHSWIEIDVLDSKGKVTHWSIEGGSILALSRQGWNRNTIKAGDKLSIIAHPLRDGTPGGSLMGVTLANGKHLGAEPLPTQK